MIHFLLTRLNFIFYSIFCLTLLCLTLSPFSHADLARPQTNLGSVGNREIASLFSGFEANNSGCEATEAGPRVLLTGFGLFEGIAFNVSGAVIDNMANPSFWPGPPPAQYVASRGMLTTNEGGARIQNRTINLRGHTVNVCLIVADVLWDFSGAIFATEMERFQPDLVILTGQAPQQPVLEASALNLATSLPGFNPDGSPDLDNLPREKLILPAEPAALPMTWNNRDLAERVNVRVKALGYKLDVPVKARPSNDYICNNVSYIALAAASGLSLKLAGGELTLAPHITSHPQIGFMHLPEQTELNAAHLHAWAEILEDLIDQALFVKPARSSEVRKPG